MADKMPKDDNYYQLMWNLMLFFLLLNVRVIIKFCSEFCFHYQIPDLGLWLLKIFALPGLIITIIIDFEDTYKELADIYQDERYSKIKGIGVIAYIILTLASLAY